MKRFIITLAIFLSLSINNVAAQGDETSVQIVEGDSIATYHETKEISKSRLLFQSRRMDRGINRGKHIFKGELMGGLSASYLSMDSENTQFYLLLNDIEASGSLASVKPYVAYFYRDNRAVGARFGYTSIKGQIDSATIDLGEVNDLEFSVPYIMYDSKAFSYSLFFRSYTPLDRRGNIALFAEIEAGFSNGESVFEYEDSGVVKSTTSKNQSYDITFNPGVSVFVFNNISASLSFEFGGLNYTKIDQYDPNGAYLGTRESSKMRFMFNVFAIKFGMNFHIW